MNKKFLLTLMIVMLMVTACASNALTAASGSTKRSSLPLQTQLILGTIKLEETANAVTADQAAELLPMWYVLKDLNSSATSAQEEIDGLVTQIQTTLTKDQVQAIADMKLAAQDMMAVMQANGGGASGTPRSSQTGSNSSGGAGGPPADMPAGGMPAGGGDPGGGMPVVAPSGSITSANSGTTNQAAISGVPPALFDAVIKLLEVKVN